MTCRSRCSDLDSMLSGPYGPQIWPEAQFPMKRVGVLTLNKNVDNFFNENEQLAFSVAHVVPGERPCTLPPSVSAASGMYIHALSAYGNSQGVVLRGGSLRNSNALWVSAVS